MFFRPVVLLALHAATVVAVVTNAMVTLAVQLDETVYTAEFSKRDLKADTLKEGDQVQAEVKDGNLIVKLKNGKRVSALVHWVQRTILDPLPETP